MVANRRKNNDFYFALCCLFLLLPSLSCNKLVSVPLPISSVTTGQVYSSDPTATAAMLGIYSYMNTSRSWSNSYTSIYLALSADELTDQPSGGEKYDQFLSNDLSTIQNSTRVLQAFWQPAYFEIYSANAVISGVQSSTANVSSGTKNQLTGEAKFIRAFCYFYLTNIFGDVPLNLSTDFNQTVLLHKSPQAEVYNQIVNDLQDAQNLMISDFSLSGGMPIRANKWAATALLARVYEYLGKWQSADSAANAVISSGLFNLVPLPVVPEVPPNVNSDSDAFSANSREAILQLQTVNSSPWCTWEGNWFIPVFNPNEWLSSQLVNAFEPGDFRWSQWVASEVRRGNLYYYPYKYKIRQGSPGTPSPENYTLLRFAEQYLIRAEAETNLGNRSDAINDLNVIRNRAGLPNYSDSANGPLMQAIQHEKRIEFFAEWGHRWLDIKRWGIAIQTLDTIPYKRPNIDSTQLLYPIPILEIQTDPNLTQNKGY